jgi:glutathione S-transferase
MIKLIQFPPAFGVPNPSPFCMKAEILLKMAGLPYASEQARDPRKGPKGKLPAIEDGGELIGDSELIRGHLERKYEIDFDKGLDETARAVVYSRWIDPRNWPKLRAVFFGGLPPVVRSVVPRLIQRQVRQQLRGQGVGRHAPQDIYGMGVADLGAVATQLGDKPFFMGAAPTGVDAVVYALVENIIVPPLDSPMRTAALGHANLVAYAQRMRERYFG